MYARSRPQARVLAVSLLAAFTLGFVPLAGAQATAAYAAGEAALKRGDAARATEHFERALGDLDRRGDALLNLADIARSRGDADALARAAYHWFESVVGADGRVAEAPPKGAFELGGFDFAGEARAAAVTRVGLAQELAALAQARQAKGARSPEELLTAAWARRFAQDLAQRSPRAMAALGAGLDARVTVPSGAYGPVLKAVERVGQRALGKGDIGTAIRAGRILRGLGVQADFTHLRGDRPSGMAKWRSKGSDMLARAREKLDEKSEAPWTVEDLEWLATAEGEAFTRQHDDFAEPGVAVSPNGWYRVESDCGYETLLAVASTIEAHHKRLVGYFGEDPFNGRTPRQGLIRVVPDPSGLEAEGAPYFWVGGFQSGDLTVIQHSVGTVEGMGRVLTHELTHRFDGALHGGIPSWLAEGRAVWTGAAYARVEDESFIENWCSPGTMRRVAYQGLARQDTLEALLSGTPEDYRHNYSGGNALYVFLSTWFPGDAPSMSDGKPVFRSRLIEYENRGKHPSSPSERFEEFVDTFCDGKDGRPGSFEAFLPLFHEFLIGFDARRPKPFTKRYESRYPRGVARTWIYDEPTWTWDWVRAEPVFGQNQAREAGAFLREAGVTDEAVRAYVWARAVDGADVRVAEGLSALLGDLRKRKATEEEALWAVRHERRGEPFDSTLRPAGGVEVSPFPTELRRIEDFREALTAFEATARTAKAAGTARRLRADLERLAAWAGSAAEPEAEGLERVPTALPPEELSGWMDEELTRLDDERPENLFLVEDDGYLLLGRREARTGSGRIDRGGGGKSFLRASRWLLPGSYRVDTQIRFTTGFNTAIAVVGWTSRERNVRLQLTAGDFEFAIGEADEEPKFETVRWQFDGMRTRDSGLYGSARGGEIELPSPSTSATLTLQVDGPVVSAWIAGIYAGSYHTIDGLPIEGFVGMGTISGAVRMSPPTVQRLDGRPGAVLDAVRGRGPSFDRLQNASLYLGPDVRPPTNGSLVFWIPAVSKSDVVLDEDVVGRDPEKAAAAALGRTKRSARDLLRRMARNGVAQQLTVALPMRFQGTLDAEAFVAELLEVAGEGAPSPRVVFHRVEPPAPDEEGEPATGMDALDGGRRWLVFLDSAGVARAVRPWTGTTAIDDDSIEHWLTVFRDHGRPERALPVVKRPAPEPEEDDDDEDED